MSRAQEVAGAFGDVGVFLPLALALVAINGLERVIDQGKVPGLEIFLDRWRRGRSFDGALRLRALEEKVTHETVVLTGEENDDA